MSRPTILEATGPVVKRTSLWETRREIVEWEIVE